MEKPIVLRDIGEPLGPYEDLTGDLDGYWWQSEEFACVPFVASTNPRAFLRFLREIESLGKSVVFPTIVSAKLQRLLGKRGYLQAVLWAGEPFNAWTDAMVKRP